MLTREMLTRLFFAALLLALLAVPLVGAAVEGNLAAAESSPFALLSALESTASPVAIACSGGSGATCGG